ncbi:MAG TPA: tryptophan synthase subunit beta [Candidatus Limnocylindrales bacterium]|nr:tryptophan synthase subunit beta [Candidatus Limnocylindrales bacterium]
MSGVLEQLVEASRRRAATDARETPLNDLQRQVARMPTARRFEAALRYSPQFAIVAELKRASPSAGQLPGLGPGLEAARALARGYAAAGATALSVLTEPTRFSGSDDDIAAARGVDLPVLRKDFLVTPFQVLQSRTIGADAVLLIARILPGERLETLIGEAARAGMDALVEVHDESELARALDADATLIGINSRDLDTLDVDLPRAFRLAEAARAADATVLLESGLATAEDVARAASAGAHGALIGTSFLRHRDPAARAKALVGDVPTTGARHRLPPFPVRTQVKVCGIRDSKGAVAARLAGADFAGIVVAQGTRRAVGPDRVAELAAVLGDGPRPVLVFRAPDEKDVRDLVAASRVRAIQLAGFEAPPEWLPALAGDLDTVIGVVHPAPTTRAALRRAEAWLAAGATHVLLEGADRVAGGGAGAEAPFDMARRVGRMLPVGIAGGLNPQSVAEVVARVRPAYVDASSGLERDGGSDPRRIARFVHQARRDPTGADRVDRHGRFGAFGGRYVPETLVAPLAELDATWREARRDAEFWRTLLQLQRDYVGRPTPLFEVPARALDEVRGAADGARLFLKREDLAHTGAHKINNALGQALLALRLGKRRLIAETGAGQHGVATATVAALFGLECVVYMGSTDIARQRPNVERMRLLGAEVRPVESGNGTLRDALNEALRDWVASVQTTFYVLGSATGPHPYPEMVAELQSIIGREARQQLVERIGRPPDVCLACVGGGSNAIGLFRAFLDTPARLIGVEAGGRGDELGEHAASLGLGKPGVLHGAFTMLIQTEAGQVVEPHSISAGLDYPGVGPQLAALAASGRMEVERTTDVEAVAALRWLTRECGILPALEPSHAIAAALRLIPDLPKKSIVVVNLSGRGDKDLEIVT